MPSLPLLRRPARRAIAAPSPAGPMLPALAAFLVPVFAPDLPKSHPSDAPLEAELAKSNMTMAGNPQSARETKNVAGPCENAKVRRGMQMGSSVP